MAERKIKTGVIGLGNMGSAHLQYVKDTPTMQLAACCDILPERAEQYGKKFDIPYFTDAEEMLKSGLVEAVTIAVPHYFHTPIAISAMEKGLHVLTEKPVGVHKNDVVKMIEAHKKHPDLVFAAMFQMRLLPVFQKIRFLIQKGELGPIRRISWIITTWFRSQAYYNSSEWRATWKGEGGGVLLNQCPHHIDLFQWFFGLPKTVRAVCSFGKYHNIEVEDEVTAYFEYPDGTTATFITSTGEAPGSNRLEITCERGCLVYENDKLTFYRNEIPTKEFRETTESLFGTPGFWTIDVTVGTYSGPAHREVIANFGDAILNGTPLIAPAEEGLNSVELANAMLYASLTDSKVELPLNGDAFEQKLQELIANSSFQKETCQRDAGSDFSKSFGR